MMKGRIKEGRKDTFLGKSLYFFEHSNLDEKCGNPDADEERIAVESVEDVSLAVNLASIDLVEQSHHDESVEDYGEVLGGSLRLRRHCVSTAVDVEQMFTYRQTKRH